jgi:hypothetical protein
VRKTAEINEVKDIVEVHHAIVCDDISLRGPAGTAETIPSSELPECDTLSIDADGAEIPIVTDLGINPGRLIIEHHPVPASDELTVEYQPDRIRLLLENKGYEIVEELSAPNRAFGEYEERIFVAESS